MTVVTDTSVVLNLCWLESDSLLTHFFDHVLAPIEVRDEFLREAIKCRRLSSPAIRTTPPDLLNCNRQHFRALQTDRSVPSVISQVRSALTEQSHIRHNPSLSSQCISVGKRLRSSCHRQVAFPCRHNTTLHRFAAATCSR